MSEGKRMTKEGVCGKPFADLSCLLGQSLASGICWWGGIESPAQGRHPGTSIRDIELPANQNPRPSGKPLLWPRTEIHPDRYPN